MDGKWLIHGLYQSISGVPAAIGVERAVAGLGMHTLQLCYEWIGLEDRQSFSLALPTLEGSWSPT